MTVRLRTIRRGFLAAFRLVGPGVAVYVVSCCFSIRHSLFPVGGVAGDGKGVTGNREPGIRNTKPRSGSRSPGSLARPGDWQGPPRGIWLGSESKEESK